jgi:hypothetical protein
MKRLSILIAIFGLAIPQHVVSPVEIEISPVEFIHPTSHFYPMPFWHMNGELTRDGIIQQMTDTNPVGFKGLAILPVHNTSPEFLTAAFFKKYKIILGATRKLGREIILYDDTGFSSGTAGGKIERNYTQHLRKSLEKTEYNVTNLPYWKCIVPEGKLMAAVAMNMKTLGRLDLAPLKMDETTQDVT